LFEFGRAAQYKFKPNGIIFDIGCNVGMWTIPLARRFPMSTIIAIDCQQKLIDCLNQTLAKNNIYNVETYCLAISDGISNTIETYNIDYSWGANFGSYELEPPYRNSDSNVKNLDTKCVIPSSSIDQLGFENVFAIKLDIEGMEAKAFAGARNTIQRDRPYIHYEKHKSNLDLINALK
jgi:FkbM family methyltransferase